MQHHVEPLWTEPGWNLHTPDEICIDSFQADRAPDHDYRTAPWTDYSRTEREDSSMTDGSQH